MNRPTSLLFNLIFSLTLATSPVIVAASESSQHQEGTNQETFSRAELEQMLAPIALYPDSILTHILIASTYPLEIIQANRWATKNPDMEAAEALSVVEGKSWDPSVKALVPFPRVLERLSDDLNWTQKLGDAFLQDEEAVLKSIQSLRQKADQAGNLEQMENMEITREDEQIIIQPIEREVVYVPYYDTRVVYGNWHWSHYQPVYWDWSWHHHHGHHYRPHYGLFSWHPRIHISSHFWFSAFNWHNHHVIVLDRHHYTSRRYRHRSHIIANNNARRWSHNPVHRRGVSYRTNKVSKRYNSNRPSVVQTQITRANEKRAARQSIKRVDNKIVRSDLANRKNKAAANSPRHISRQDKLRKQLNKGNTRRTTELKRSSVKSSSDNRKAIKENKFQPKSQSRNRADRELKIPQSRVNKERTQPTRSSNNNRVKSNGNERARVNKAANNQSRSSKSSSLKSERRSSSDRGKSRDRKDSSR